MLNLRAAGHSRKQIAHMLGLSEHTVKHYSSTAFAKLGASDLVGALRMIGRLT